ncbi:4-(cytidine 5'-diphospho)-2-C-methyl-D-erythritol kinase [Cochlodiniinecator piscidefendens]|uniref:4-(cytidine 5'-diphospho)-2-C-methyl-D-erythritol kinase n=1 Tax=Cochlodiniinecator piscidefendens TaxID=2715756 RepID=UPI00140DAFDD
MTNKEFAPAKVNLALHITGQRGDGYHFLDSLVVFAGVGDTLSVQDSDVLSLQIDGAFGEGLHAEKDNLVLRVARLMDISKAALWLEKDLPIASGIGGGSADAAAALRLLSRHFGQALPSEKDTLTLGADVPVCLRGTPVRMRGIGDILEHVPSLPPCFMVLVNPGVGVSTPAIFKSLTRRNNASMEMTDQFSTFAELIIWLRGQRNDMQAAAISIAPEIADVLVALEGVQGCALSRMSGSGATCFGLFETKEAAAQAEQHLREQHPDWWVQHAPVLS